MVTERSSRLLALAFLGGVLVTLLMAAGGTVHPDRAIAAHETAIVSPWETYYMWTVSFVAGVWVLTRFLRGWRFDRSTLSFAPREERDA